MSNNQQNVDPHKPQSRPLADFLPTISIKAKDLIRQEPIKILSISRITEGVG